MYTPPEGKTVRDIETAWIQLEKAEHERELALREELIRLVIMYYSLLLYVRFAVIVSVIASYYTCNSLFIISVISGYVIINFTLLCL